MPMIVKSYTVSNRLHITQEMNGAKTGTTSLSEEGARAELLLTAPSEWHTLGKPDYIHLSVEIEIERMADMNGTEFRNWLRDQLVEMLAD